VHALVGENGAGKSTLMRILAGIYTDFEGSYHWQNKEIRLQSPKDALSRGIGMIHQELSVMPELSVTENLFLGRQLCNRWGIIDWPAMHQRARQELAQLGFESVEVDRPLGNYPLGTQQVVEVLRVIISGAKVLIMDEPTSALSPAEVGKLIDVINALRKSKRSIIYISHFLDEVMRVADRVTVLRDGKKIATLEQQTTSVDELISFILGRSLKQVEKVEDSAVTGDALLELTNLNADVFKDISFKLACGEIVGLYGAVGAGHFDLARALFGMYRFDSGEITVSGHRFPKNFTPAYAINRGLAYATESRRKTLLMDEAIFRNVSMPHLKHFGRWVPSAKREVEVARSSIAQVGVQPNEPFHPVGKLSGGNQQKVVLARWLAFPPKVFVLSEPTRGMDVGAKQDVLKILRDLRNKGYGVVVVASEPETVLDICNRILVMSRGQIVADLPNKNLDKDSLMRLL
jgi:ribose transport system ATP-binding protein